MLGSEYNWLISLSRPGGGAPRVRMARTGLLTLAIAVFCAACVALHAEPAPRELLRAAAVATQAGDHAAAIAKLEAVRVLRPDYPRVLRDLARAYAAAGRTGDALAQLRELAAMGLDLDLAAEPAFATMRTLPAFAGVQAEFSRNRQPTGRNEDAWTIAGADGIFEGIACRPGASQWFLSDVHNRCLWRRDAGEATGRLIPFSSSADNLLGVFGLRVDEPRHALWAGTSAVPEMAGYTTADKGRAALVEFDLTSGRVRHSYPVPADGRDHVLGDVLTAPDGGVFTSDSSAPVIWWLPPAGGRLEKWLESADFVSLQGMVFSADGKNLIVADYGNGLWRIELATRVPALQRAPARTTLFGIDGIYAVPGGLVAVQNGISPQRILRVSLAPTGEPMAAKVLMANHAGMSDLALGQVVDGRLHFIGESGWARYENPAAAPTARSVPVFSTALD